MKIFAACLIGLHAPLLVFLAYVTTMLGWDDPAIVAIAALLLVATLLATILTLLTIHRFMMPIRMAAEALEAHGVSRGEALAPAQSHDEAVNLLTAVQQTLQELDRSRDQMQLQAVTDPLTGAGNRRLLIDRGNAEIARANRQSEDVAVILVDLDRFKLINEAYGYELGDQVLIEVVDFMHSRIRPYDTLARMGGEEFCIVLPGVHQEDAALIAERIRAGLAKTSFAGLPVASITASFGVTERRLEDADILSVIGRADERLSGAKSAGRNRVSGGAETESLSWLGCTQP